MCATITEYLPLFVRRFAKERLQTMARQEGRVAQEVKQVLFVCRGNAGRSQMAAAFAEHFGQGHVRCLSAGTDPLAEVLPQVRQVMIEKGIELPEAFPKPVTAAATEAADVIVTMGVAEDALPARGKQQISWDIAPVVGESLEVTRATRDDIEQRTRDLVKELLES